MYGKAAKDLNPAHPYVFDYEIPTLPHAPRATDPDDSTRRN
jgi:hypothetical protein